MLGLNAERSIIRHDDCSSNYSAHVQLLLNACFGRYLRMLNCRRSDLEQLSSVLTDVKSSHGGVVWNGRRVLNPAVKARRPLEQESGHSIA